MPQWARECIEQLANVHMVFGQHLYDLHRYLPALEHFALAAQLQPSCVVHLIMR